MNSDDAANVRISIGKPYENVSAERVEDTQAFADDLRRWGLSVDVEVIEYVPGRVGLGPVEWTAVFIGTSAGAKTIGNLADDVYEAAKDFLRKRKRSGRSRPNLGVKIYGPDGEELTSWTTREDDERADPPVDE